MKHVRYTLSLLICIPETVRFSLPYILTDYLWLSPVSSGKFVVYLHMLKPFFPLHCIDSIFLLTTPPPPCFILLV